MCFHRRCTEKPNATAKQIQPNHTPNVLSKGMTNWAPSPRKSGTITPNHSGLSKERFGLRERDETVLPFVVFLAFFLGMSLTSDKARYVTHDAVTGAPECPYASCCPCHNRPAMQSQRDAPPSTYFPPVLRGFT
jgi:hypothetical protein